MSDCEPSEARRTRAVWLQAPYLLGFLGEVKGLNVPWVFWRLPQGSLQRLKLRPVKIETAFLKVTVI